MDKIRDGGRLYLRSLSQEKPSELPAKLDEDFPNLSADFTLPPELEYVSKNLFSSILRISGRVNMWLHYDVRTRDPSHDEERHRLIKSYR